MSQSRDEQGRFPPGVSGNPAGAKRRIPKWVAKFRALEPKAMALVAAIIDGTEESSVKERLEAVKLALSYSRGRPRESIELTGRDGGPIATTSVIGDDPARTAEILRHLAGVGAPPSDEPTE